MTHTTSSSGKGTRALRLATGLAGLLLLLAGSAAATSASTNTRGVAIPPKRETVRWALRAFRSSPYTRILQLDPPTHTT